MRIVLIGVGVLALFAMAGCGPAASSATGKVTYEGEPIKSGNITFSPASGPIVGTEIKNGSYSVKGLSLGKSTVNIIAIKDVPFARSSEDMAKMAEEQKLKGNDNGLIDPADIIPDNAEGNNKQVEIKAGAQEINFDLLKPTKK